MLGNMQPKTLVSATGGGGRAVSSNDASLVVLKEVRDVTPNFP